jgi:hypothetical protein
MEKISLSEKAYCQAFKALFNGGDVKKFSEK